MAKGSRKVESVMGHRIAPPRMTPWAPLYLVIYGAGPALAVLGALDLGLFLFFRYALDRCYGIACLFTG